MWRGDDEVPGLVPEDRRRLGALRRLHGAVHDPHGLLCESSPHLLLFPSSVMRWVSLTTLPCSLGLKDPAVYIFTGF